MKLINKRLNVWREAWSKHRMRATRTSSLHLRISGQLQNPIGFDIPPESLELYGVEVNVEDDSLKMRDQHLFHLLMEFLTKQFLRVYMHKFPWMIFQQIMALMTILQLITLSRDTIQTLCEVSLYQAIIKKFLGTFLQKYLFNDLNGFIYKFTQIKLWSTSRVNWLRFVY